MLLTNIAQGNFFVKAEGLDTSNLSFIGQALTFESQETFVRIIVTDLVSQRSVVYTTTYLKTKGIDKACVLLTDGHFSPSLGKLSLALQAYDVLTISA